MTDKRQKATKVKCKRDESIKSQFLWNIQKFLLVTRPQAARSEDKGCFRRLGLFLTTTPGGGGLPTGLTIEGLHLQQFNTRMGSHIFGILGVRLFR